MPSPQAPGCTTKCETAMVKALASPATGPSTSMATAVLVGEMLRGTRRPSSIGKAMLMAPAKPDSTPSATCRHQSWRSSTREGKAASVSANSARTPVASVMSRCMKKS